MKRVVISAGKKALLRQWAEEYENSSFLEGDPSWFMHQVEGRENQEVMAFLASCLSYGSRPLFMPKIQRLLDLSGGNPYEWVMSHGYEQALPDSGECFYRLYTCRDMRRLLASLHALMDCYGSMGGLMLSLPSPTALSALEQTTAWFSSHGSGGIIPLDTRSACKRLCMWLRWMVRDGSEVDLGLWSTVIDKRTLIMPLVLYRTSSGQQKLSAHPHRREYQIRGVGRGRLDNQELEAIECTASLTAITAMSRAKESFAQT